MLEKKVTTNNSGNIQDYVVAVKKTNNNNRRIMDFYRHMKDLLQIITKIENMESIIEYVDDQQ